VLLVLVLVLVLLGAAGDAVAVAPPVS